MINATIHQPKVSILIPVFNRKDYITECIQSALDQTFTDFEVVIVDNASDDGTWEICQQFAVSDQRVRIFRNETNIGPVRNWVRCAQEAKGSLSKILFSDDTLERNCLSEMVPELEDPTTSLVYCAAYVGPAKSDAVVFYSENDDKLLSPKKFLNLILTARAPVSPGAILLRTKDLLENLHLKFKTAMFRDYEKNGAGPDVMILILTAHSYNYVAYIKMPLVFFRAHKNSFSIANTANLVTDGYHSVFSLYLARHYAPVNWICYISFSWLHDMKLKKHWVSPKFHLCKYEGSGSLVEVCKLIFYAVVTIANKAAGKKLNFIR